MSATEWMHVTGQCMLGTMQLGVERTRRIWTLRAEVRRLERDLTATRAALEVEEREQSDEGKLIRDMFEQWKADLRAAGPSGGNQS